MRRAISASSGGSSSKLMQLSRTNGA
jgi:hypothetical protein